MRNKQELERDILELQRRGFNLQIEGIGREIDLMVISCKSLLEKGQIYNCNDFLSRYEKMINELEIR